MSLPGRLVNAGVCLGLVLTCGACTSVAPGAPGAGSEAMTATTTAVAPEPHESPTTAAVSSVAAPPAPAGYHRHRLGGLNDNQFVYVTDAYETSSSDDAPGPIVMVTVESEVAGKAHRASLGLTRVEPADGSRELFAGTGDDGATPVIEVVVGGRALLLTTNEGTSVAQLEAFARDLS